MSVVRNGDYAYPCEASGQEGTMGKVLMAIVAQGKTGRVYVEATEEQASLANGAIPERRPETKLPHDPRNFWTVDYGLDSYGSLFTDRQLVALNTFSDLVYEAREEVERDALAGRLEDNGIPLRDGGSGAQAYAQGLACTWRSASAAYPTFRMLSAAGNRPEPRSGISSVAKPSQ